MTQKTEMRGEPMPEPVTLPIGTALPPKFSTSRAVKTAITSLHPSALAFRELRHPASKGYRYRDTQDTDRTNG